MKPCLSSVGVLDAGSCGFNMRLKCSVIIITLQICFKMYFLSEGPSLGLLLSLMVTQDLVERLEQEKSVCCHKTFKEGIKTNGGCCITIATLRLAVENMVQSVQWVTSRVYCTLVR